MSHQRTHTHTLAHLQINYLDKSNATFNLTVDYDFSYICKSIAHTTARYHHSPHNDKIISHAKMRKKIKKINDTM